jgi:leucyl-tRNA synthetase
MTDAYNPAEIEPKWQAQWEADQLYRSTVDWDKPKHYALTMLPYPSGDLHIGHWFAMTPSDARARFMRMRGYNVLFPMGFDAFGLPAENAAIQRNIHPKTWTYANIERMRKQLRSMGAMFDWQREAVSCDPAYYHWTEWFFARFFESELAYRGEASVNWSPTLQTVLANEQVIDGRDERTGQPVIQKLMSQWFFRITRYADELLDFSGMDWPERVKAMQTNWINRSEGARVNFPTETGDTLEVFTTRPDTLWGATFVVLAPEHPLVDTLTSPEQAEAVTTYKAVAARASELDRLSESREKTGVFTGGYATNPVNGARIPVWIADYVLITYGTGAIMAVPAHDQRDFDFARTYGLDIVPVIQPQGEVFDGATMAEAYVGPGVMINSDAFNGTAVTTAKGRANPAINAVIDWLEAEGIGREAINYRLRDWLISRQRYWGAPIPAVYGPDGTIEMVPYGELPVLLPDDVEFMPTGQSPLQYHDGFLQTTGSDGRPARRETDTMDTFMCSSWYQYRYLSPEYDQGPFDPEEAAYWLPVDVYTGGAEHATMHLLYTRFFTKAMRDMGVFDETAEIMRQQGRDTDAAFDEPMLMLRNQGQILGAERLGDFIVARGTWDGARLLASELAVVSPGDVPATADGVVAGELMRRTENVLQVAAGGPEETIVEVLPDAAINIPSISGENTVNQLRHHLEVQRMSKSKGNVVNPDELVAQFGADVVRAYLMFFAKWDQGGPWNYEGIKGAQRLISDVWDLGLAAYKPTQVTNEATRALRRKTHQVIRKVTDDLDDFSFNTAVAALMELRNTLLAAQREGNASEDAWAEGVESLLLLLAPIAPHVTEELWHRRGHTESVHVQAWPSWDEETAREEVVSLVVQVNGRVREKIDVPADTDDETLKQLALESGKVQKWLEGKTPRKVIVVRGTLVNIVL